MRNKKMYVKSETRFQRYMRRTLWNKLVAIGLFIIGLLVAFVITNVIGENDITVPVFIWIAAVGMFFARTDLREP
jgi:hypothetical protein